MTAPGVPAWVDGIAGPVVGATRLRAGFTNESWAVATSNGRRLVVTRMAEPGAAGFLLDRCPALIGRLADSGIASPIPIADRSDRAQNVVTSTFVDGAPGMDMMDDDSGAALVGRIAGATWLALGAVDASGLGLDDLWARPSALTQAALTWIEPVADSLGSRASRLARRRIAELPAVLENRRPGFLHGDFVPANILIAAGALTALLDLETVRVGEPLLDAAWFRWNVRYHHPMSETSAWAGFAAASRLDRDDSSVGALIPLLPVVRILEILAGPALPAASRTRWVDQLHACVGELPA